MKKLFSITALVCALCIVFSVTSVCASGKLQPTKDFFVNDFAGVISEEDYRKMYNEGVNLYKACKAQVVAVTVNNLGGEEIEDYSYNLANDWGIGDKEEDSGILLLLSVEDRKVRIEVGSGLEGAIPDGKTGRILDTYGIEHFKNNEFSAGLAAVYDSIVNEIYIEYDMTPADPDYESVGTQEDEDGFGSIIAVIIFLILVFLVLIFASKFFWIFPGGGFRGGFGGGGLSGGFGGFSGGSSNWSGGGGGFSGGGGGFSGGGSSRGF